MVWVFFFLGCNGKAKDIAACEEASVGFNEYLEEILSNQDYKTCSTYDDCKKKSCINMCGTNCFSILSNNDSYSLILELLQEYEQENCQVCENYPYPEREPIPEPVSEPPDCFDNVCGF